MPMWHSAGCDDAPIQSEVDEINMGELAAPPTATLHLPTQHFQLSHHRLLAHCADRCVAFVPQVAVEQYHTLSPHGSTRGLAPNRRTLMPLGCEASIEAVVLLRVMLCAGRVVRGALCAHGAACGAACAQIMHPTSSCASLKHWICIVRIHELSRRTCR